MNEFTIVRKSDIAVVSRDYALALVIHAIAPLADFDTPYRQEIRQAIDAIRGAALSLAMTYSDEAEGPIRRKLDVALNRISALGTQIARPDVAMKSVLAALHAASKAIRQGVRHGTLAVSVGGPWVRDFEQYATDAINHGISCLPSGDLRQNMIGRVQRFLNGYKELGAPSRPAPRSTDGTTQLPDDFADLIEKWEREFDKLPAEAQGTYLTDLLMSHTDGYDFIRRIIAIYLGDVAHRRKLEITYRQKSSVCHSLFNDFAASLGSYTAAGGDIAYRFHQHMLRHLPAKITDATCMKQFSQAMQWCIQMRLNHTRACRAAFIAVKLAAS